MASSNFEALPTYNILLLGETGVGKSTFINAFVNYATFDSLTDAEKEKLTFLVSTRITVTDDDFKPRTIVVGDDLNECEQVGASATQSPTDYVFNVGDVNIRLIDTPGVADTRGVNQDNINFDKLLFHIGELKELHAICILLKPNESKITIMFEYCIKQLFSRLDKSASQNIVFLFTNTRGTHYRPGETLPTLMQVLEDTERKPPYVKIPISKENIFCIDNEAFRFLLILKNGITFKDAEIRSFVASWEQSSQECLRLISYVAGMKPHQVQNTISVNEARRLIIHLSQPLADITGIVQKNIAILQRKKEELQCCSEDVAKLKSKLSIPVINLKVEELSQPQTVCMSQKCSKVYLINGEHKYHCEKPCCVPCFLPYIPLSIIGAPELIFCQSMLSKTGNMQETILNGLRNMALTYFKQTDGVACKVCDCSYKFHKHVYYNTRPVVENVEDSTVNAQIKSKEGAREAAEQLIRDIEKRLTEYEKEQHVIIQSLARFAHFLQNNAISPYNDGYEQFLDYTIECENSNGALADTQKIKAYEQMLSAYREEKMSLDKALHIARQSDISKTSLITASDVMTTIQNLYYLRYSGNKIEELFKQQTQARQCESRKRREVQVNITKKSSILKSLQKML